MLFNFLWLTQRTQHNEQTRASEHVGCFSCGCHYTYLLLEVWRCFASQAPPMPAATSMLFSLVGGTAQCPKRHQRLGCWDRCYFAVRRRIGSILRRRQAPQVGLSVLWGHLRVICILELVLCVISNSMGYSWRK